jgi:uncharacterized protein (DUF362 family)
MTMAPKQASRRRFVRRLAKAGLLAAATGFAGWRFHDPHGPTPQQRQADAGPLPAFDLNDGGPALAVARGADRSRTLPAVVDALGGMARFVRPGDRVVLKVNAAFAAPASLSATTHPEMVKAVTELCFSAGAGAVVVTDNPINDPGTCFELSGIANAASKAGAQVVLPAAERFAPVSLPGGRLIQNWPALTGPLAQADRLIGLAPVKDHHRSGASMTMKNWYGLLGGRRNIFHQDIHSIITELALAVRPTLVILDGTTTMISNGPTGGSLSDLRATHTVVAGTDQVAVDTWGARLLERQVNDLPYLEKAAAAGAGTTDVEALSPVVVSV